MALDRQKQLQQAERLLKQGKVPAAMLELERLADSAPNDVLTLNRIGDLLAKQERKDEAIRFYNKIAEQFCKSGFLPKAVAIHKKVLRLNPNYVASLVQLGELYFQQKLPGEARSYLLRAAEQYLQGQNYSKAREVYEHLVQAEPNDPRHRARLAETRAAEGEPAAAGHDLLALADTLFASGKPQEAERTYRRAAQLIPDEDEPLLGLVRSLSEQGREAEAIEQLDKVEHEHGGSPAILGERVLRYELAGRARDSSELLKLPAASEIEDEVFLQVFRHHCERMNLDDLWNRMDPVFAGWDAQRVRPLYTRLCELEEEGHVPALQRLLEMERARGDQAAVCQTLETLIRACRARSKDDEADSLVEQLRSVAPDSPLLGHAPPREVDAVPQPAPEPPVAQSSPDDPVIVVPDGDEQPPIEAEAPAVPLNRGDEEYVAGRLTQTEILEKYGLREQAVQQVREVTQKFPGHVVAQEKLVQLLQEGGSNDQRRDALVALALARRANGDTDGARQACREASADGPLSPSIARMLAQLGLLETTQAGQAARPTPPPVEPVPVPSEPQVPSPSVAQPPPSPEIPSQDLAARAAPSEPEPLAGGDGVVMIDFDAMGDEDEEPDAEHVEDPQPSIPIAPARPEQIPIEAAPAVSPDLATPTQEAPPPVEHGQRAGQDYVAEIGALIDAEEFPEARRRLDALETLVGANDAVASLRERLNELHAAADPEPLRSGAVGLDDVSLEGSEDDDLSAITAALESELFAEDVQPTVAEPESEQSLEEVFAAFKDHVDQEVGSEDYRTHYDLGIAYKEMGLISEAVSEFQQAVKSPELGRESYIMLALCYRERDEMDEAARCYREAIASTEADPNAVTSLRYELGELLLVSGDPQGALDQFRHVMQFDPSYRDVQDRVTELESRAS